MSVKPGVRQLGRLSEIGQAAARHGFGYLFERRRIDLRPWRLSDEERDAGPGSARGQRLRELLDELGPTFVKFGQLLSTRPDVVPPDIVHELRRLQDEVRPFPFSEVERVIEAELGLTVAQAFRELDPEPIAAASIGQVHRGVLPNGSAVAVKVQRPNAPRQIESDLELMYQAARVLRSRRERLLRFVDPVALVDEFAQSIRAELDYGSEARNAERFRRNFAGDRGVHVPQVFWSYSGARLLTLELLDGTQLGDLPVAESSMAARRELAYRVAEIWMTMIFRHGFFHGDPHPANVLLLADGRVGLIDFGQVGKLSSADMTNLTKLFIDAARENVDALPRRLADLGVQYPRDREQEFAAELREVYERYYGTRLSEIDPMRLLREALGLVYRMNLRLPSRFVLLDKALATLGAVGVELYPDFNVFEVARPYARDLMLERFRPRRIVGATRDEVRRLGSVVAEYPYQVSDVLEELRDGHIEIGFRHQGVEELSHKLDLVVNRLVIAVVAAGGIVGSALLGALSDRFLVLSVVGFCFSGLLGAWLVWGVVRSGRL
ncbi:MAG: AarF/ABC1/UbiB kinase family protein [Gaiellales bacterium]